MNLSILNWYKLGFILDFPENIVTVIILNNKFCNTFYFKVSNIVTVFILKDYKTFIIVMFITILIISINIV